MQSSLSVEFTRHTRGSIEADRDRRLELRAHEVRRHSGPARRAHPRIDAALVDRGPTISRR
jgi:hypothetical protein